MTPELCRAARAFVSLTERELADEANVAPQTVADFERGARTPHANNIRAMVEALEKHGVEFMLDRGVPVGLKRRSAD